MTAFSFYDRVTLMDNIYLVGFMGTGKTCVGRELARMMHRQFVDLDELIELKERKSIPDIFAQNGQAYFRTVEKLALRQVAREKGFVVACGGGIVTDEDNIRTMKNTGTVICLQASVKAILQRTASSSQRPLLNVPNPAAQIELLLKMRAPYYAQAHACIDTTFISVQEAAAAARRLCLKQDRPCLRPSAAKKKKGPVVRKKSRRR